MGRVAKHRHLRRRGNVWWVRVAVPRALRDSYRSPHVERSLGTESVAEAEHRKLAVVFEIQAEFRRKKLHEPGAQPQDEAGRFRAAFANAATEEERELIDDLLVDRADEIAPSGEDQPADPRRLAEALRFLSFARADKTLREAWADWMHTCDLTPGTKKKYARAFDELLSFLSVRDTVPNAVTAEQARAYVDWINTKATNAKGEPLDPETKRARALALSSFWRYLAHSQLVPHGFNPWRGHAFTGARQKARQEKKERAFTPEEMLALIHGPERGEGATYSKHTILQLHALGFYTGARLDELCSRRVEDFEKIKGGYLMRIREAKTPDGVRDLPVLHPIPVAVIRERIGKRKDGFLFTEFVSGGPDEKRSWQIQKAMGDYRRTLGVPEGVNFHSTRRTFATVMERLAINHVWAQRYFGHRPHDLMAAVYAAVAPESLRKVAQVVKYPAKVETAFRKALAIR